MSIDRRDFVRISAGAVAASTAGLAAGCLDVSVQEAPAVGPASEVPESIRELRPMLDGIEPITDEERLQRMEKARRLMVDNGIEAIYLEPGRMAKAARWSDLTGQPRPEIKSGQQTIPAKPWLDGLPRLIFISDMSDALSKSVSFDTSRPKSSKRC